MSEKKKEIVKHVMAYVPSRYFSQFLGFFTSLFMKRFLGPFYAGIWDLLKLIMQYVDYTELGSTLAIYYKVPLLCGQEKKAEADKVKNVVFGFVMGCSIVSGIGIVLYALIFFNRLSGEMFWGLLDCAVIIVLERVHSFYVLLMRAYKDFVVLAKSVCFDSIVNLLLVLLIVNKFKIYGLYWTIIILTVLNILYIRRNVAYDLRFIFDWRKVVSYIQFGFPVYLTSVLTMMLNSIDRVMIIGFLGFEQLGFYSIALMSKSYSHQLSTNFSHVTSPHFMEDFGRHGNSDKIIRYIIDGTFTISCLMSIVLGLIYLFSGLLVTLVLPSFLPGLVSLKIFLFTSYFASLVSFPTNYIVTQNKQKLLVLFAAIALILNTGLNFIFIKLGFGINGVATSTAISSFVYLLIVLVYAILYFARLRQAVFYFLKIVFPCIYACLVVFLLEKFVSFRSLIFSSTVKAALFCIASLLIIFLVEKETKLVTVSLRHIKEMFDRKR
ncbi:MAG: polysaccharide biosynthesis C-terminal domain-containing protein [Candidatus Omnitrophica bacterium]|nr:polysaccharide biosynthesis C-terminal domain-containing protein [Candidatus Omnitrophota bacterium]